MTGEGTERRRWGIPVTLRPFGALAALALIYVLALGLGWGGGLSGAWLSAWAAAVAATSLLSAALRAPQTPAGKVDRDMWRWFGVAAIAWCAGATVNAVSRLVISRAVVTVSPADLFLLVAPIAIIAGFIVPVRLPRSPRPWLRYLADTYVCACALFVVGWVAIFDHLYHVAGEGWVSSSSNSVTPCSTPCCSARCSRWRSAACGPATGPPRSPTAPCSSSPRPTSCTPCSGSTTAARTASRPTSSAWSDC